MPDDDTHRYPRELDLAMHFLQIDGSWYENYRPQERQPRPAGLAARDLATILSSLCQPCDRVLSLLWHVVLSTHLGIGAR
jgi:hypothetical protein